MRWGDEQRAAGRAGQPAGQLPAHAQRQRGRGACVARLHAEWEGVCIGEHSERPVRCGRGATAVQPVVMWPYGAAEGAPHTN